MLEINKIYNEDCLSTLKKIDNNSIDCVVTSPPYYNLRAYTDDEKEIGREMTPNLYIDNLVEVFSEIYRVLKPNGTVWVNIGDSYAHSNPNNRNFLNNGGRISNNDNISKSNPICNGIKEKDLIGIPWMLAFALRDRCGFYLRQDIIWAKGNPLPEPVKDRCVKSHEYIFLFSKSKDYYFDYEAIQEPSVTFENRPFGIERQRAFGYDTKQSRNPENYQITTGIRFGGSKYEDSDDPHYATKSGKEWNPKMKNLNRDGQNPNSIHINRAEGGLDTMYVVRNKRDVWNVNTQPSSIEHCAMYPEKLIMPCILAGCPECGIVYDPFIGSGTTALATIHALGNRKFIGSELSPKYYKIATKRVNEEMSQLKLF